MGVQLSNRPSVHPANRVADIAPLYLGSLALSPAESLLREDVNTSLYSVSAQRLSNLGLDRRDMAILKSVADCRLMLTQQLQRLHFRDHATLTSSSRACRRVLKRLTQQKIIQRRKRRIGGVRKGSASYVYSVGTTRVKLLNTPTKQLRTYTTDPSDYFFEHTVGLAELYTNIREQAAVQKFKILELQTEPYCWRQFPHSNEKLRPDMYLRLTNSIDVFLYFIEYDRGTTHQPSILRKVRLYMQYYASGVEQEKTGTFPQVLWLVPDTKRKLALSTMFKTVQNVPDGLFVTEMATDTLSYLGKITN